jgi:hypothetical protein
MHAYMYSFIAQWYVGILNVSRRSATVSYRRCEFTAMFHIILSHLVIDKIDWQIRLTPSVALAKLWVHVTGVSYDNSISQKLENLEKSFLSQKSLTNVYSTR